MTGVTKNTRYNHQKRAKIAKLGWLEDWFDTHHLTEIGVFGEKKGSCRISHPPNSFQHGQK
jgi:hypothetical protein